MFAGGRPLEPVKGAEVIARSPEGVMAMSFALGRGRVVVVSDPYPVANKGIQEGDNVIFAANILWVLQPSRVIFDESGGVAAGDTALGAARPAVSKTVVVAGVQAALAILLLYVFWGQRFGRPVPLLQETASKGWYFGGRIVALAHDMENWRRENLKHAGYARH